MNQRVQWRLYVDESGSFSAQADPGETVVLAGVLLREADGPGLAVGLLERTRRYFPGLPTPLHAAHLFSPAFHLPHRRASPQVGPLFSQVQALADGVGTRALARLDEAARGDDLPSVGVLEAWRRAWLPFGSALTRHLRALREQDPGIVLADLAASLLRRCARGFGAWATVAASAPRVIGLPVQLAAAGLPAGALPTLTTLAASDCLKEALWEHRDVPMHRPRGWSGEQAQRWFSAAKAGLVEVKA